MTYTPPPEVKVYGLDDQEIHMMGDYVAVCWNLEVKINKVKSFIGGTPYEIEVRGRCGDPYLAFLDIREDRDGSYKDDDSPVEGGFSPEEAEQIANELQRALAYMEKMGLYKPHITR